MSSSFQGYNYSHTQCILRTKILTTHTHKIMMVWYNNEVWINTRSYNTKQTRLPTSRWSLNMTWSSLLQKRSLIWYETELERLERRYVWEYVRKGWETTWLGIAIYSQIGQERPRTADPLKGFRPCTNLVPPVWQSRYQILLKVNSI